MIGLRCRIGGCGRTDLFDSPRQAIDSAWEEPSPDGRYERGVPGLVRTVPVHPAYCPVHALHE